MSKKFFLILISVGIIIIGIGSYIFFLKKSEEISSRPSPILKRKIKKEIISKKTPSTTKEEQEVEALEKIKEKEELKPLETPKIKIVEKKESISQPTWTEEFFVTHFFIEDLCKFIISSYYPPHSLKNSSDKALLNLDFKVINARYGVKLSGFRIHTQDVEKARKKILTYLMKSEVLESIYAKYSDLFVKELYELSKETEKTFIVDDKKQKRTLNSEEIKTLFLLLSDYLSQVSKILSTLANNPTVFYMVKDYIKAQNDAVHFNFLLNQILNEYKMALNKNEKDINKIKARKKEIIQKYKLAIQKRENIRKNILQKFKTNNLKIADHEILYIVEWFYRRFHTNPDTKVLISISDILEDLSVKLKKKANSI